MTLSYTAASRGRLKHLVEGSRRWLCRDRNRVSRMQPGNIITRSKLKPAVWMMSIECFANRLSLRAWSATGRALRPVAEAEARECAFVCAASHDLVTPLMTVTANCDVLEAEASDQAGLASWVANIRAAADEMATRIADMLMHMGGD